MKPRADALLVAVTKVETEAVLQAAREQTGRQAVLQPIDAKTYFDLGSIGGARVWLVRSEMGAGGLGASMQTITKALAALTPGAVIMVGIAFGVNETKQAIGDVLVSEGLRLYDLQRVGTKGRRLEIILRGDRPHASTWLLDRCRAAELSWKATTLSPSDGERARVRGGGSGTEATVRFGLVLSGEKLVDNLDFREQLRALEPEAIGGEMEGAGLYVACHEEKTDWILVKAICDWADGHKNRNKSERQALAARNAARFVLHLLRQAPLKRKPLAPRAQPRHPSRKPQSGAPKIVQSGSGGLAIGPGAVAAGNGGVAIGGNVSGCTIVTGDRNTIKSTPARNSKRSASH
jgi:nucleoside phosphorylase